MGREWGALLGLAVVMGVLGTRVSDLLVAAWDSHRTVYHVGYTVVALSPVRDPDIFVVLGVGTVGGLLVFFAVDARKHRQGLLLLIGAALFGGTVFQTWAETVSFFENLPWAVGGLVLGAVASYPRSTIPPLHSGTRGDFGRRWEFPYAGLWLYVLVVVVSLIGLVERYVPYRSPIVAQNAPLSRTAPQVTASGVLLDVVSVGALVILVAVFVDYSNEHRIVLVSEDRQELGRVIGGLFRQVSDPTPVGRDISVLRAVAQNRRSSQQKVSKPVTFAYAGGLLATWQTITAEPITLRRRDPSTIGERVKERQSPIGRLRQLLRWVAKTVIPGTLTAPFSTYGHIDRIDDADTIFFVLPASAFINASYLDQFEPGERGVEDEYLYRSRPRKLKPYIEACTQYTGDRSRTAVLVVTEGDLARRAFALDQRDETRTDVALDNGPFLQYVEESVLQLEGRERSCDVIVVDRPPGEMRGTGFESLARHL
ncbi:hypothetical protein [Salinigranum salinum]|uniref:hypothetical protein n=1 Tax=Salinigranum salinum TaxID=1364937 RepID=UPI001260B0B0|nr:hypothetical protein [Salinigranum salinum]